MRPERQYIARCVLCDVDLGPIARGQRYIDALAPHFTAEHDYSLAGVFELEFIGSGERHELRHGGELVAEVVPASAR